MRIVLPPLSVLWVAICCGAAESERLPVPPEEQRDAFRKKMRQAYRTEYAAKKSDEKQMAARKFLDEASNARNGPTERYVFFEESHGMAVSGNDFPLAMKAIDGMEKLFQIDGPSVKAKVLLKALATVEPATAMDLRVPFLGVIDAMVAKEDYAKAQETLGDAIRIAKKTGNVALVGRFKVKKDELDSIVKEWKAAAKAREALSKKPEDSRSHLALGRYLCLCRGQWDKGLPHLARGSDAEYREVALLENQAMVGNQGSKELEKLGDEWTDLLKKKKGDALFDRARDRAIEWYRKASAKSASLEKVEIGRKIEALEIPAGTIDFTDPRFLEARLESNKVGEDKLRVNQPFPNWPPPSIGGVESKKYLWAHAPSKLVFRVAGLSGTFKAKGVRNATGGKTGVLFVVKVDGQIVHQERASTLEQVVEVEIKIRDATKLELVIDPLGDGFFDHTYWCEPRIEP
jgi:hypothetical protein